MGLELVLLQSDSADDTETSVLTIAERFLRCPKPTIMPPANSGLLQEFLRAFFVVAYLPEEYRLNYFGQNVCPVSLTYPPRVFWDRFIETAFLYSDDEVQRELLNEANYN